MSLTGTQPVTRQLLLDLEGRLVDVIQSQFHSMDAQRRSAAEITEREASRREDQANDVCYPFYWKNAWHAVEEGFELDTTVPLKTVWNLWYHRNVNKGHYGLRKLHSQDFYYGESPEGVSKAKAQRNNLSKMKSLFKFLEKSFHHREEAEIAAMTTTDSDKLLKRP